MTGKGKKRKQKREENKSEKKKKKKRKKKKSILKMFVTSSSFFSFFFFFPSPSQLGEAFVFSLVFPFSGVFAFPHRVVLPPGQKIKKVVVIMVPCR